MTQTLINYGAQSQPLTVSIIGSAGRRGDGHKMTKQLFSKMVEKARTVIKDYFKLNLSSVHAISGGAAWADHVAVVLFVHAEVGQLTLHLPAKWEEEKKKFVEKIKCTGSKNSWKSPGKSANELHKQFSEKLGEDTLEQIDTAKLLGAKLSPHDGFQRRNTEVAKSQFLIAFTWGEGNAPTKGGTLDTWSKCSGKKIHISLLDLITKKETISKKRSYTTYEDDDIQCDGPKRSKIDTGEKTKAI